MPPGVPGRTPYNTTGHQAFQTDPAKAKALLKSANALGYEIKFLFRTDDPMNIKVKDAIVKALTEAGFKATPVPTTTANYTAARDNTKEDINVRSAGWCSDWPSGSTWLPPVLGSTDPTQDPLVRVQLRGLQQQGCGLQDGRHPADAAGQTRRQPGTTWTSRSRRSTSRCSRPTTAASPRPTGRGSRATTTTTRWACRPGRTCGSRSNPIGPVTRPAINPPWVVGRGIPRAPPPLSRARSAAYSGFIHSASSPCISRGRPHLIRDQVVTPANRLLRQDCS